MSVDDGEQVELQWHAYLATDWALRFPPGARVLDVGCGPGQQMEELRAGGCDVRGVEPDRALVDSCRSRGLDVVPGAAEALPEADASYDGVVCKVVIPYTREDLTVKELARVLRPGGTAYLISHGAGYFLRYLLMSPRLKVRFYGARSLMNTWWWILSHHRLPGFLGDTLYQSRRRLRRYYSRAGLDLVREAPSPSFMGFPVFLFHELRRRERP